MTLCRYSHIACLSIAKYQLICVGNAEYILKISTARADTVRCLTLDAYDRRCIIPHPLTRGVNAIERREKRPRDEYMDLVDSKKTKLTSGATSKSSDETLPPLSQKYTSSELKAFLQDDNSNNESESSSSCSSSSSS